MCNAGGLLACLWFSMQMCMHSFLVFQSRSAMDPSEVDFEEAGDEDRTPEWQAHIQEEEEMPEAPAPEQAAAEESQDLFAVEPQRRGQPVQSADIIRWETPNVEQWVLQRRGKVRFDQIRFDISGREGQARILDPKLADVRRQQIQKNPPSAPIEPWLWQEGAGGKYVPLTLQHTTKALMMERESLIGRKELPEYLQFMRGNILKADTPLAIRQAIAGSDQNRQESSSAVRLSRFAEVYLEDRDTKAQFDRCCSAIARTGYPRPTTKV